ncbi:MAG: DUF4163 domain-containing protein [Oscillospiraceae bacterium]|jgi:hypothetical protein|nr:DUF4163 domain-containing protein [Oscillospiraceae bacterium]MDD3832965.1 DUF4163 domain-containing protein [Oscillospiraceae bacterium]
MSHILTSIFALMTILTAPLTNVGDIAVCPVSERVDGNNFVFSGNRPRFSGMGNSRAEEKLNAVMHERFETVLSHTKCAAAELPTDDRSKQFKAEGVFDYEVKRNSNGVVSLLLIETVYDGKAQTTQLKTGFSFFTGNGQTIKLPQLFLNSEEGIIQINEEILRQVDSRGLGSALVCSKPAVNANQPFYLTDTALTLIIPTMTWFGGNMGIVEFTIPISKLKDHLNPGFVP